jgi:hypothetical protein
LRFDFAHSMKDSRGRTMWWAVIGVAG